MNILEVLESTWKDIRANLALLSSDNIKDQEKAKAKLKAYSEKELLELVELFAPVDAGRHPSAVVTDAAKEMGNLPPETTEAPTKKKEGKN